MIRVLDKFSKNQTESHSTFQKKKEQLKKFEYSLVNEMRLIPYISN